MNLDRRTFLKSTGVVITGIIGASAGAATISDNYYSNKRLGLGFLKPNTWLIDTFRDFDFLNEGVRSTRFNPDQQHLARKYFVSPDAIVSKYQLDSGKLNPSIHLHHYSRPVPDSKRQRKIFYRRSIHNTFERYRELHNRFKVIEKPKHRLDSGCDIYESKFEYNLERRDFPTILVHTKYLEIFHKDENYKVLASSYPGIDEIGVNEERSFIDSIHLI